jgi:hypothetical protein
MTTRSASDEPASDPKPAGQLPDIHPWRSLEPLPGSESAFREADSTDIFDFCACEPLGPTKSCRHPSIRHCDKRARLGQWCRGWVHCRTWCEIRFTPPTSVTKAQPGWARHGTTLVSGRRSGARVGDRLQKNKRGASRWVRRAVASMSDEPVRSGRYDQRRFVPISHIMSS